MFTLLSGSGARSYSLVGEPGLSEDQFRATQRAKRLLQAEGRHDAVTLLERYPFQFVEGTNDFGDEFFILHLTVSVDEYVSLKREAEEEDLRSGLRAIQKALGELGHWPRFIVCAFDDDVDVKHAAAPAPQGSPPVTSEARFHFQRPTPIDIDPAVAALDQEKLEADVRAFEALLDANVTEHELHSFLARRSYFFNGVIRLYGASPLYSKVKLGSDFEVDFACFDSGSSGPEWNIVELEPVRPLFTKAGDPSAHLTHAIRQVLDWQTWIHENLAYARRLLPHLEYPLGWIFIGRRSELTPSTAQRLKRLQYQNRQSLEIHTLDWLAAAARSLSALLEGKPGGTWPLPAKALSHASLARGLPPAAQAYMDGYFRGTTQQQFAKRVREAREHRVLAPSLKPEEEGID